MHLLAVKRDANYVCEHLFGVQFVNRRNAKGVLGFVKNGKYMYEGKGSDTTLLTMVPGNVYSVFGIFRNAAKHMIGSFI